MMSRSNETVDSRPVIPVACGALINARGEVLIAQRPAGKIAAGKWEFPGGKIEPGESPQTS
ncbi:NUDIX domain-containing protein, partial [Acinetobacter baumannii]